MKNILKKYFIDALSYMAYGLFASLIIGLIITQIATIVGVDTYVGSVLLQAGNTAKTLTGGAIGVAIAISLNSAPLVTLSSITTGFLGYSLGGPIGAYVASIVGAEVGNLVSKKTPIDIIITPITTIIVGCFVAIFIGEPIGNFMDSIGNFIIVSTEYMPLPMGILVGTTMGLMLTLPISSAAICIMLSLSGLSAGAACAGCCAQMVGFATISYRENKLNGVLSQGLGTSMLQISNIIKNPLIWIPPTIASAICGGLSTTLFKMSNTSYGAGMGTSGLVGQFGTIEAMGFSNEVIIKILILNFIVPIVITLLISEYMRKKGYIKFGDMKLAEI